jgi:hypothetical protein
MYTDLYKKGKSIYEQLLGNQLTRKPVGNQLTRKPVGTQLTRKPVGTQLTRKPVGTQLTRKPVDNQLDNQLTWDSSLEKTIPDRVLIHRIYVRSDMKSRGIPLKYSKVIPEYDNISDDILNDHLKKLIDKNEAFDKYKDKERARILNNERNIFDMETRELDKLIDRESFSSNKSKSVLMAEHQALQDTNNIIMYKIYDISIKNNISIQEATKIYNTDLNI